MSNVARTMVDHVLASAENVTATIGEDPGPYAERAVRKRLVVARVFLASIQRPLAKDTKWGSRTISQLENLLNLIERTVERAQLDESKPRAPERGRPHRPPRWSTK